ncbi:sterile alpha motif domain-containing protein 9-like isoform X2 [Xenia sp. Carnegie-2017]|uniref:sterile alpha motif domain-containing protein 9-like isoform X2 n=1 Tax=Xenia sp. Carnegie-2017 TaxID=2897299 RepID=UPI001F042A12|nr:sterile alpha motif domain-containing protein 9-like isoform X2 [Xenia sp. Carnegie-2017]
MASGTAPNNQDFSLAATVLEAIDENNLFEILKKNDFTDKVLNYMETENEMRNELQTLKISRGVAVKFSKQWFKQWKLASAMKLDDLYRIEKDKWEVVLRTQGKLQLIEANDVDSHIKNPLTKMFDEWKEKQVTQNKTDTMKTVEIQVLSTNVRNSLKDLNFKENSFILIANKVPLEYRDSNILAFLKMIPWLAVFDLFDIKTEKDGLYFIVNETNDRAKPIKKELHDFSDSKKNEELLKVDTTWITRGEEFHEKNWTRYSKDSLYKALSAFCDCPTGRPHCVFLFMSDTNLQEMVDIIEASFTIIQGNDAHKHISVISDKKELEAKLADELKNDIKKDMRPPCSVFGVSINILKNIVMRQLGAGELEEPDATSELPYLDGCHRPVPNKRITSLTDLEVYLPVPKLSEELEDIRKAKENFYKGNAIDQMNLFHNHAIQRTLEKRLCDRVDESLKNLSSLDEIEFFVETVTLRYESGSGATTLGRQILWKKREIYRCAVVKKITETTDYQISKLQKFLFETSDISHFQIPPVLILLDNFPEQQVHHLSDKLTKSKTKCILLSTVPVDKQTHTDDDNFTLGKLDVTETRRVHGVLSTLQNERISEAVKVLSRERRFVWLGLELFGREYADIKTRLAKHIEQILSKSLHKLKHAFQMILHYSCLLDYYNKRRSIFPHPCVEVILYFEDEEEKGIDKIHDKFGGLLLEDRNELVGYYGWRPVHTLVGEVVREGIDLFETAKKLMEQIKNKSTYVNKFLTEDIVTVFLHREKIAESQSDDSGADTDSDGIEDELVGILEKRTKYSKLILDVLPNQEMENVRKALDLLITLNETVELTQHKAHTLQQIARMFAYEIQINPISEELRPIIERLDRIVERDYRSTDLPENGFDTAQRVIDEAIKLQVSHLHHFVTKATFYRIKLKYLQQKFSKNDQLKVVMEDAMKTTRKGIDLYEDTLKTKDHGSYLHAIIGKIQTMVVVVEMFKKLPYFVNHPDGADESFKNYLTFHNHPPELVTLLSEDNMEYFIYLTTSAVQDFNDFFGEIQIRRKLSYKKHEFQELENAKIRAMKLRTRFYEVTKLDRTAIQTEESVLKEDIVNDLLYKLHETPYSSWARLSSQHIEKIYNLLKQAVPRETRSRNAMLIYVKAAVQQDISVDKLLEMIQNWCKKYPDSDWAHMYNYMIHFPIPNGSLKTNVDTVKRSINICRMRIMQTSTRSRRSGADYLLGKGIGAKAIIPPHVVDDNDQETKSEIPHSRSVQLETKFWRSKIVFDKLERLKGKKIKKVVLNYKGIEIPFDNDRYPHESRDDLLFCLGFTITGPYAYDPIDKDTYKALEKKFKEEMYTSQKYALSQIKAQKNGSSSREPHASNAKITKLDQSRHPSTAYRDSKPGTSNSSSSQHSTNLKTAVANTKHIRTVRTTEGDQKTFRPIGVTEDGYIYHGAKVRGADKSTQCKFHKKGEIPPRCKYAHPWKNDPVRQTICELCTKNGRPECIKKAEHEKYHHDLGPYMKI